MKSKLFNILFLIVFVNTINAQLAVSAPGTDVLLSTIQGIITSDSSTNLVIKSKTVTNALTNAKTLEEAYRIAETLSKVSGYIKKGRTIQAIYETEANIIKKAKRLSSSFGKEFGDDEDTKRIVNAVLDGTGLLVDKAIKLVTDDVFNMEGFQREGALEDLLVRLKKIEQIIATRAYKNSSISIDLDYQIKEAEKRKEMDDNIKARRERINQIK